MRRTIALVLLATIAFAPVARAGASRPAPEPRGNRWAGFGAGLGAVTGLAFGSLIQAAHGGGKLESGALALFAVVGTVAGFFAGYAADRLGRQPAGSDRTARDAPLPAEVVARVADELGRCLFPRPSPASRASGPRACGEPASAAPAAPLELAVAAARASTACGGQAWSSWRG